MVELINSIFGTKYVANKDYDPVSEHMMQQFVETGSEFAGGLAAGKMVKSAAGYIGGGKIATGAAEGGVQALKPLGLGSTGRTAATNLVEQMAMEDVVANPQLGKVVMTGMKDSRWLGWSKMQYTVETQNGVKAVVHYVGKWDNGVLKAVDDFKFK